MYFFLPLISGPELNPSQPLSYDPVIPVLYRLAVVTTAKYDGECYSYDLAGDLAEKRHVGEIKDTFHCSPLDPFAPWGTSMKIDAIILYDSDN